MTADESLRLVPEAMLISDLWPDTFIQLLDIPKA